MTCPNRETLLSLCVSGSGASRQDTVTPDWRRSSRGGGKIPALVQDTPSVNNNMMHAGIRCLCAMHLLLPSNRPTLLIDVCLTMTLSTVRLRGREICAVPKALKQVGRQCQPSNYTIDESHHRYILFFDARYGRGQFTVEVTKYIDSSATRCESMLHNRYDHKKLIWDNMMKSPPIYLTPLLFWARVSFFGRCYDLELLFFLKGFVLGCTNIMLIVGRSFLTIHFSDRCTILLNDFFIFFIFLFAFWQCAGHYSFKMKKLT